MIEETIKQMLIRNMKFDIVETQMGPRVKYKPFNELPNYILLKDSDLKEKKDSIINPYTYVLDTLANQQNRTLTKYLYSYNLPQFVGDKFIVIFNGKTLDAVNVVSYTAAFYNLPEKNSSDLLKTQMFSSHNMSLTQTMTEIAHYMKFNENFI